MTISSSYSDRLIVFILFKIYIYIMSDTPYTIEYLLLNFNVFKNQFNQFHPINILTE